MTPEEQWAERSDIRRDIRLPRFRITRWGQTGDHFDTLPRSTDGIVFLSGLPHEMFLLNQKF